MNRAMFVLWQGATIYDGMTALDVPAPPEYVLRDYLNCNYDPLMGYLREHLDSQGIAKASTVTVDTHMIRQCLKEGDRVQQLASIVMDLLEELEYDDNQRYSHIKGKLGTFIANVRPATILRLPSGETQS